MIKSIPWYILLGACTLTGFGQKKKQLKPPANFTVQQLGPGVWAAIHNDQYGKAICNAGIVDLGDKTLVFDPFMNPVAAQELKEVAEELTNKPVAIVVDSHYHNDHIRGNQVFAPYATIISTNYTRNKIAEVEPEEQAWERRHAAGLLKATRQLYNSSTEIERQELQLWIGYYEGMVESAGDLKITLPDVVFNDSLWILGTERDVKLMEFKNGHTASDVVMCIPDEQIAFAGDLLFVQRHPWMSDGDPASWQASLEKLYADKFMQTYVPGHGPVCKKDGVKTLYDYFGTMRELVDSAVDDSVKTSLLLQNIPAKYRGWYFGRFYQNNMKFLLATKKKDTPEPQ